MTNFRRLQSLFRNFANSMINPFVLKSVGRSTLVQCNSYGSLNVRRLMHMIQLYKRLYNESTLIGLVRNLATRYPKIFRSPKLVFGGGGGGFLMSASLFSFSIHGIADEEMMTAATSLTDLVRDVQQREQHSHRLIDTLDSTNWDLVTNHPNFLIWRRPLVQDPGMFEYRCAGTFFDVPACGFFIAQIDLDYRKQWDQLVIVLDVIDADDSTGNEVIRWVTHFPFPMYPREYVYVRRSCVDMANKTMVVTSKTVDHPRCPKDAGKFVRVENYYSCMVIKPHSDFEENGFDYVLTYFDDPKAPFPTTAYNWMVTTGVPGFVQKVYNAAKALSSSSNKNQGLAQLNRSMVLNRASSNNNNNSSSNKMPSFFDVLSSKNQVLTFLGDNLVEMGENQRIDDSKLDADLSELLDSSFQDFGKSIPVSSSSNAAASSNPVEIEEVGESVTNFDPKAAQQAAVDFQKMLQQIAEVQKVMMQNMNTDANNPNNPNAFDSAMGANMMDSAPAEMFEGGDEAQFAEAFIKNMQFLADKAQKVGEAKSEDEFANAMQSLSNDETYESEFMPFMQGLMGCILSKEVLYPSLKEMCEKYPVWLEEHKSTLDNDTLVRYETQLRLMQEACKEYEEDKETDTDEIRDQRFERLICTMQKMQACGHPPEELVGSLPPGWSFDDKTGVPRVEDTTKAAENCCLM